MGNITYKFITPIFATGLLTLMGCSDSLPSNLNDKQTTASSSTPSVPSTPAVPSVTLASMSDFTWSHAGSIAGLNCVQWLEPSDPDTWTDNYLCSAQNYGLQWFYNSSPPADLTCVQINEPGEPVEHGWTDNYLCSPTDMGLRWSYGQPIAGMNCLKIDEPADGNTWDDNYLCLPQ